MRGAAAHLCTGMPLCTFGSPSPRPSGAAVRSVWGLLRCSLWRRQAAAAAEPILSDFRVLNGLHLGTEWQSFHCVLVSAEPAIYFFLFFQFSSVWVFTNTRKKQKLKSMADNRENEGTNREPAGGEGRWPADNKLHNTYTNFIQVW